MNKKCCEQMSDEIVILPEGKHYSKTVCSYCGKFKKWNPNPNITKTVTLRNKKINQMLKHNMTEKRRDFLIQMLNKRFLTPKQLEYYKGIKKYLQPAYHDDDNSEDENNYDEEYEDEKIPKWVLEAHRKKWEEN